MIARRNVVIDNSAPVWAKHLETDLNSALTGIGTDVQAASDAAGAAMPGDVPTARTLLGFAQSLGASGYIKLPGSPQLIIQWGTATISQIGATADHSGTITFGLPFPTACYGVEATINAVGAGDARQLGTIVLSGISASGASISARNNVSAAGVTATVFYIAAGV